MLKINLDFKINKMSREIKFRAWDKDDKQMHYGLEVGYLHSDNQGSIIPIEEMQLMQYTGLKDKEGKEIYEGDIVTEFLTASGKGATIVLNYKIEYTKDRFWMVCLNAPEKWIKTYPRSLSKASPDLKVIGNIHENKKLLK